MGLAAPVSAPRPTTATATALKDWFQTRTQALYDGLALGDRAIWDQTLDASCIITSEDGEVVNKAKFLADLHPLPPGFQGHIFIRDLTVRQLGAAAVVNYWLDESETIFTQQFKTLYVATDTYRRVNHSWKAVAMQTTVVPRDMEPIATDETTWPALVGTYAFPGDPQPRYRVFLRAGKLFGGRDEETATPLIPLGPQVFQQQGSIHIMLFAKEPGGEVTEVRELHKYNEIVMRRMSIGSDPSR